MNVVLVAFSGTVLLLFAVICFKKKFLHSRYSVYEGGPPSHVTHPYRVVFLIFNAKVDTFLPGGHLLFQWASALAMALILWKVHAFDPSIASCAAVGVVGCISAFPLVYLAYFLVHNQHRLALLSLQ